ncbi:BlaI/MecI/CopY family transcriptional regulator [Amycolatopsis palatopharyngis]|uniref:BlaI/MecI/CopY family transcriptional regulator n=1 Tax=Amycolatopsis palatopharyngis TaxID=187982 RepID=UPI001B883688|nr:BlaI/MecI/CopY family transcriptional regulator [Amycolatopsis palatopharyngis]
MSGMGEPQGDLLRLGALEAQVMDVLWDHGPATIREVIEHLPSEPAYTTIATVLSNLDRKHLVTITRQNRSTRYTARTNRHEHAAQLMEQVLQASRDRAASILQFVDSMPENDLDLLRDYLKRRDEGQVP